MSTRGTLAVASAPPARLPAAVPVSAALMVTAYDPVAAPGGAAC
jgi:hypothetical protein